MCEVPLHLLCVSFFAAHFVLPPILWDYVPSHPTLSVPPRVPSSDFSRAIHQLFGALGREALNSGMIL